MRILVFLLACYPLSQLYATMMAHRSARMKHSFMVGTGATAIVFLFSWSALARLALLTMPVWLLLRRLEHAARVGQLRRSTWLLRIASPACFAWLLGHVAMLHYQRWISSTASLMDLSVIAMLLTVKLTGLVHHVLDHLHEPAPAQSCMAEAPNVALDAAAKGEMALVCATHVGLLPFAGFVLCFNGLATGPVPTFAEYVDFVHRGPLTTMAASQLGLGMRALRREQLGRALLLALGGGLFLALWTLLQPHMNARLLLAKLQAGTGLLDKYVC